MPSQEIVDLFKAHQWYALSVLLAPLLLGVIRKYLSDFTQWLPKPLQFLPASLVVFLTAFAEAASSGVGWQAALLTAFYLTVIGAPAAVGLHHMGRRVKPKLPSGKGTVSAVLLGALLLPLSAPITGCAAAGAAAAAWLPAVLAALTAAGALLDEVGHWVDRFRDAPGIPPDVFAKADKLLADARVALDKTAKLAARGSEFQGEAEQAWQEFKRLADDLLALLEAAGLYSSDSQALVAPQSQAKLRADGTTELEAMRVSLPPERLQ